MKKITLAALLLGAVAASYFYAHHRELTEDRRQQTANLLARCVNESLLSLFRLQANDWRRRPEFYRREAARFRESAAALPARLLEGEVFPEWRMAVAICEDFTAQTNTRHRGMFEPLGAFAALPVGDNRLLADRRAHRQLGRTAQSLQVGARAASRYSGDLRQGFAQLVSASGLSAQTQLVVERAVNTGVLDRYRSGHYALARVEAHLQRVQRYYRLLAENPRGWSLRAGSLYFHNRSLRREVEPLNSAILQGEGEFFASWAQVMEAL